jgi:hypothetical protein
VRRVGTVEPETLLLTLVAAVLVAAYAAKKTIVDKSSACVAVTETTAE